MTCRADSRRLLELSLVPRRSARRCGSAARGRAMASGRRDQPVRPGSRLHDQDRRTRSLCRGSRATGSWGSLEILRASIRGSMLPPSMSRSRFTRRGISRASSRRPSDRSLASRTTSHRPWPSPVTWTETSRCIATRSCFAAAPFSSSPGSSIRCQCRSCRSRSSARGGCSRRQTSIPTPSSSRRTSCRFIPACTRIASPPPTASCAAICTHVVGQDKTLVAPAVRGDTSARISDRIGVVGPGTILAFEPSRPDRVEYVYVTLVNGASTPDQPATVTLAYRLQLDHEQGTDVQVVTPQAPAATNAFVRDGIRSDRVAFIAGMTGVTAGVRRDRRHHGVPRVPDREPLFHDER